MNKPVKQWKVGGVTASLWENERFRNGRAFKSKSVSLTRSYQDGQGNWKDTNSYNGVMDLVKARTAIDKAIEFLLTDSVGNGGLVEEVVETPKGVSTSDPYDWLAPGCETCG